jgi:Tol biopolymer transport system component
MNKASLFLPVLLASLLLAAPAQAAWPGKNGAIAFSRSESPSARSKSDIWIETRSGKQRRLTTSPRIDETEPRFSPNGRLIVYVRRADEDADIWLMRSDGSDKRPVVDGELDEFQPSFFPSGRSLVFTVFDGERDWNVRSVKTDGKGQRRQVSNATFPIVSPNGRWLAYSQDGDGGGIRLLNLRSGDVRRLTTGSAQQLDFSPNGRRIVFTGQRPCRPGGSLRFVLLTIGLGERRARILRRGCEREFIAPAWSPNGKKIAFTRKQQRGGRLSFQLGVMTAGGAPAAGAPRHRAGTNEIFPSWQPLR